MFRGSPASAVSVRRRTTTVIGVAIVVALLSGCGGPAPLPGEPTAAPSIPASATTAPPASTQPQLVPDGTAADNLPLFAAVTAQVWDSAQRASGRGYVDALVDAGFDKERMQVTEDLSTVGNPAESLQFSVAWGAQECLIGQVGPSTGEPVTAVMPQLAEDRCLIGETRSIDW